MTNRRILNYKPLYILFSLWLVVFVLLTNSVNAKAATGVPSDDFPYLIGIPSSLTVPTSIIEQIRNEYINLLGNTYQYDVSDKYIIFCETTDGSVYNFVACSGLNFNIGSWPNTIVYTNPEQHYLRFYYNSSTGVLSSGTFYGGSVTSWTYTPTSLSLGQGYIISSALSEFSASYGSDTVVVWSKSGGNVSDLIGEFSDLPSIDTILDNITNTWEPPSSFTGHALPSAPTENPNNTDFQNRLQMFDYLADTITQNFGNLGYNISGWFNKLQQKLTDVANSISTNIFNGFDTLMSNIRDFFGAKLDHIIETGDKIRDILDQVLELGLDDNDEFDLSTFLGNILVPDPEDLVEVLNDSDIGSVAFGTTNFIAGTIAFVKSWFSTPAVKVFHLPTFSLGGQTFSGYVIDFSWYDNYKSYGDAIISFFLILNYAFFLFRFLPRFFRSAGSGYEDVSDSISSHQARYDHL